MNFKYFSTPRLSHYTKPPKPMFEHYGELNPLTVQTNYPDLAFDFNCGMRLRIPEGNWHVKILDHDSEVVCFDEDISDTLLISMEKFFVRWEFFLWLDGKQIFHHLYTPGDWTIHFDLRGNGLGDSIVMLPYMEEFRKKWHCKVSCTIEPPLQEIMKLYYLKISISPPPELCLCYIFH